MNQLIIQEESNMVQIIGSLVLLAMSVFCFGLYYFYKIKIRDREDPPSDLDRTYDKLQLSKYLMNTCLLLIGSVVTFIIGIINILD